MTDRQVVIQKLNTLSTVYLAEYTKLPMYVIDMIVQGLKRDECNCVLLNLIGSRMNDMISDLRNEIADWRVDG